MSNDTDKLAAQMKNLRPSKASRESGMDAAMAAFNQEFASDAASSTDGTQITSSEKLDKKIESSQGLADEPRPTGTHTKTVRVISRGVETMAKVKNLFNIKPQTMMMAGTCSAALIAAMIVVPNMDDLSRNVPTAVTQDARLEKDVKAPVTSLEGSPKTVEPEAAPKPQARAEIVDEITVTARKRIEADNVQDDAPAPRPVDTVRAEDTEASSAIGLAEAQAAPITSESPPGNPIPSIAPTPQGGGSSLESFLSEIPARPDAPQDKKAVREFPAALQQRGNVKQFLSQQGDANQTPPPAFRIDRSHVAINPSKGNPRADISGRTRIVLPSNGKSAQAPSTGPEKIGGLTLEQSAPELKTVTETIVVQPASVEYVQTPPVYETFTDTVVVQEASTELVVIPPEYEWVDGEIEGSTIEYEEIPAEYETVSETVVVQPASAEYVSVPPVYETVKETLVVQPQFEKLDGTISPAITEQISRRVVKTPASTMERIIPAVTKEVTRQVVKTPKKAIEKIVPFETKDGKTRVVVKPGTVQERIIPPVAKEEIRRVIKTPASTIERVIPAVTKEVQVKVIAPPKFYLRDDDGNVVREFESRDAFEAYKANLPTPVSETPVSTFSVDVDTSSYSFLRASINRGQLPPRESIRLEEMINYFPYDYDAPKSADEPFKANVTVTSNPWNEDTKLMHIGIKGYVPKHSERPRSNLVFLIDTSGSMNRPNKLPLLINSFKLLLNTLDENDTVSIVAYASASGTVLEPTRVKNKSEILAALNNLRAGGSTAGAAGLELAYQKAQESFDDEGVNRVILATDGDFNVGFSSPDDMKTFIQKKRKTGIFLSVLGFGMGNYNDHLMQSLAQNGNGVAAYIDNLSEANKVLANEAGSALFTIAKDVKIQVEFNPDKIAEYRLIGYETRALKRQDFNNDKVDAGEIGAGHSVTAIYEMTPVGSPAITVDKLRYVAEEPKTSTGSDEYAFVKIRHKLPDADKSTLQTFPIGKRQERSLKRASDDMRFATAVAIVGQKLRGDTSVEDYSYEDAIKLAKSAKGEDENGYRAEFIRMVQLIDSLGE